MPKVLQFIFGILRSKLIAVFLGPEGAGILSQLREIIQSISAFTLSGMNDGVVKQIAQENSREASNIEIAKIIKTYGLIIIPLTIIVFILGYCFAAQITEFVFGDIKYKLYFQIGFVSLPITILSTSSFAILKAYKKIKIIALSTISIMVINLIVFVPLIYFFQLVGAVFYLTFSFFVNFAVYSYLSKKKVLNEIKLSYQDIFMAKYSTIHFKELFRFFSFSMLAGSFQIGVTILIRSIVAQNLGVELIGVYSPIITWSGLFTGFILGSLTTYLFPRISEARSDQEIVGVTNEVFRLMTFLIFPFIVVGIATRNWIIPAFYSADFSEAAIYLPYHFAALVFGVWSFAFAQIFAPTGRLRKFLSIIIFHNSLSLALVYFLTPVYGLYGWMAMFTITPVITLCIYFIFWYKTIHFRLEKKNILLAVYVIGSLILLLILQNRMIPLNITGGVLILLLFFIIEKKERRMLSELMLKKVKRKKG